MAGIVEALAEVQSAVEAAGIERVTVDKTLVRTPGAWLVPNAPGPRLSSGRRGWSIYVYLLGEGPDDARRIASIDDLFTKLETARLGTTDEAPQFVGIDLPSGGTVPALRIPIEITV